MYTKSPQCSKRVLRINIIEGKETRPHGLLLPEEELAVYGKTADYPSLHGYYRALRRAPLVTVGAD